MISFRGHAVITMGLAVVGLAAAAPVYPGSMTALDGSWTVARATVNGVARASAKMLRRFAARVLDAL